MKNYFNRLFKYFTNKNYRFYVNAALGLYNSMEDEAYLKLLFKSKMGKELNLENPTTFNEKLQWLKLYDRRDIYTTMVDKYEAKNYVASIIDEEYIIPTIGVWDHFHDIDFSELPDQFVMKCTHDSGGLVIVRNKDEFDKEKASQKICKCLKQNYYLKGREWPYKNVKPRIIVEKYLENAADEGLIDYKFFCFNGEPRFLYISQGLEHHQTAHISFVSLDWTFASYKRSDYKPFDVLPGKPKCFDEMLKISRSLAKDIPFIRVDLYVINEHPVFSELTFSPCSGFIPFEDDESDIEIGKMLNLSYKS